MQPKYKKKNALLACLAQRLSAFTSMYGTDMAGRGALKPLPEDGARTKLFDREFLFRESHTPPADVIYVIRSRKKRFWASLYQADVLWAYLYQVDLQTNPVGRITGEGRAEFLRTWGSDFYQKGGPGGGGESCKSNNRWGENLCIYNDVTRTHINNATALLS